jgi:tellurite methyltransferase
MLRETSVQVGRTVWDHYARDVERSITGFHLDDAGDWVAELACGHNQHVRHRPPFQLRAWVLEPDGRLGRLGTPLDCPLCDRCELPEGLRWVRRSAVWDERTMPAGLRRAHRVAAGTWGRIVVQAGRLRFVAATAPTIDVVLGAGSTQSIPPEVTHEVAPLGAVRFCVEFFAVDRTGSAGTEAAQLDGPVPEGDPACWAGLLCPDCGAVVDGGDHRPGCSLTGANP